MARAEPLARPARVGLIVNPLAGAGGPLALHGSDALAGMALRSGWSNERAAQALEVLDQAWPTLHWFTGADDMGATLLGGRAAVLGTLQTGRADDTRRLARELAGIEVDLLLFAGGDGTARDVLSAVGERVPVLGIPAGVKMQSACFGVSPRAAGRLASAFLASHRRPTEAREVMDLDEAGLNQGQVVPSLFGYLNTPIDPLLLQGRKSRSEPEDRAAAAALAESLAPDLRQGVHLIGPGSTTWALKQALGVAGSLIGVDVVADGKLHLRDADEASLWALVAHTPARLWLTAIGGQGHVIGRGNAPLSARVLRKLGRPALTVLMTPRKLHALQGAALRVDSGCTAVDELFAGPVRVQTGPREQAMMRLVA